jgi:hypothetical protein
MDERAINGAAIAAINDLGLDCEIKDVCKGGEKDEWCIQFSGKYGQLCDVFQNQFGKENSSKVIREKIKSHLIKQVTKIRSNTGRRRKPAVAEALDSGQSASGMLTEPLKVMGEVLGRATGLAGDVISRASSIAETARATLAAADLDSITAPVTVEIGDERRESESAAPARPTGRTTLMTPAKAKKATAKRATAKKAAKRVARRATKQAKKAGASAPKRAARAKKSAKKAAQKKSRRGE